MPSATLVFGWVFPVDHEFPWDAIELPKEKDPFHVGLNFEDWWEYLHNIELYGEERRNWWAANPTPIEWTSCVNSNNDVQDILYLRGYVLYAEDPLIIEVENLVVLPKDLEAAQEFMRKYEITGGQGPAWWLTCDYF